MVYVAARTWIFKDQRFASFPALHLEHGQVSDNRDESIVVYVCIDHPEFRSLSTESILAVVTLKVVHSIYALFVEHNQTFVGGPAELDNLSLIPLFTRTSSVSWMCRPILRTYRKDQEAFSCG